MKTLFVNNNNSMSGKLIQEIALTLATQTITYMEQNTLDTKNSSLTLKWECGNMFGFHVRHNTGDISPCLCVFQNQPTSWEWEDVAQIIMSKVRKHFFDKHHMTEYEKRVQSLKELAERHRSELLEVWAMHTLEQEKKAHELVQCSIDRYLDMCERERETCTYRPSKRENFRSDWYDYEDAYLRNMGVSF